MKQTVRELHLERTKMWEASIENHKRYIDKSTGLFASEFVEKRVCPVCGSQHELHMFYKEGGRYVKCNECSMVYLNPVLKDTALKDYYERNHALQSEIVEDNVDDFYVNIYTQGIESIKKVIPNALSILDVGCSSGVFLDIAKQNKFETFGVELNKTEVAIAEKKGHKVYNDLLENIKFDGKFDAITMWDVFEHLKDGSFYLNIMKNLLSEDGIIFLQIPSSDALAAKMLQEKCNMFDGLEHVNLYGVETIKKLANESGVDILDIQTVISEVGVINNYLNYEDPYLGNTKNREFVSNIINEEQIHETLQGYKLQVVLGKK